VYSDAEIGRNGRSIPRCRRERGSVDHRVVPLQHLFVHDALVPITEIPSFQYVLHIVVENVYLVAYSIPRHRRLLLLLVYAAKTLQQSRLYQSHFPGVRHRLLL